MKRFLQNRLVYHCLIWIIGILIFSLNSWLLPDEIQWFQALIESVVFLLPLIPIVYLNFYLKHLLFDQKKYLFYFLLLPLQLLFGVFLIQMGYILFPEMQVSIMQDFNNIFFSLLVSIGLQYLKREVVNQYQLQELKTKNAESELNSLKAQINPHFLFNTLNNIYATNQFNHEKGSEMILELAEVMRYHLDFSKRDSISLADELQLINAYIALERLRLTQFCELIIDIEQVDKELEIAPLLLLPFIENAFKHGTHPMQPCFVKLQIMSQKNHILVRIENSIISNKKVVKTHIGLENTLRRLALIYPNTHHFRVLKDSLKYIVTLNLQV